MISNHVFNVTKLEIEIRLWRLPKLLRLREKILHEYNVLLKYFLTICIDKKQLHLQDRCPDLAYIMYISQLSVSTVHCLYLLIVYIYMICSYISMFTHGIVHIGRDRMKKKIENKWKADKMVERRLMEVEECGVKIKGSERD